MITALIGLGNSGKEYERTYHNVGSFVANEIAGMSTQRGSELLVYPVTGFMNESGVPVRAWLKLHNTTIADCIVVHDDSDLAIGAYKLVRGGGSAGHKGIESLVAHLGTSDFWRLKVGVRDPRQVSKEGLPAEAPRAKAGEFVLRQWRSTDEQEFLRIAAEVVEKIATL